MDSVKLRPRYFLSVYKLLAGVGIICVFVLPLWRMHLQSLTFRNNIILMLEKNEPIAAIEAAFRKHKESYECREDMPEWIRELFGNPVLSGQRVWLFNKEGLPPVNVVVLVEEATGKILFAKVL